MIETAVPASNGSEKIENQAEVSVPPISSPTTQVPTIDPNIGSPSDPALRAAWKRLIQYDRASFYQKQQHVRVRALVMLLSFLSSFVAVVIASKEDAFSISVLYWFVVSLPIFISGLIALNHKKWSRLKRIGSIAIGLILSIGLSALIQTEFIMSSMHSLLQFLVFSFALFASGFLAYATRFIPSELWAKYRFSAEMIRRHIYLYRMQAGDYFQKSSVDQQAMLVKQIDDADEYCSIPVNLFVPPIRDEKQEEFDDALKAVGGEKGFAPITVPTYLQDRLWYQHNWYVDKSFNEYRQMRRLQIASIVIGAIGSILVFRGYAPWVAVTTVAAVSVNMLAGLSMYGRTYSIYLKAANKLRQLDLKWKIAPQTHYSDPKFVADFIQEVEMVFKEELDQWIQQVEKSVSEIEQEISSKFTPNLGDNKPDDKKV